MLFKTALIGSTALVSAYSPTMSARPTVSPRIRAMTMAFDQVRACCYGPARMPCELRGDAAAL